MLASRSFSTTSVFVLRIEDVETFVQFLVQDLPRMKFSIKCSDTITRYFDNFGELKAYTNPERAAIQQLRIRAVDDTGEQTAVFMFNSDTHSNVTLSLDGEVDLVTKLNQYWEDFVAGRRPWYSWICTASWGMIVYGGWLLLAIIAILIMLAKTKAPIKWEWPKEGMPLEGWGKSFILGSIPALIVVAIERVKKTYFPTGTFAIGDGVNRHANQETVRTVIIAGFVISIITTVVLSWFI
ncbi:hypothetical protein [Duganella qianjiadongensis]|uniref:Uncharacterized protein n=1 Tax=Duganella qianjiadongensis TaxID=2692176 RepID=A0ABW9VMD3_9BURK|nr:hypothetical protein [Duganella qianjiadongensis]MYM40655.1 hypothetical protein [Duganella qianjiadongensis]